MKVPVSVENAFIPMEVEDIPSLQEQRKKRNQYWTMLRRARVDFIQLFDQAGEYYPDEEGAFYYYLEQNYGLRVELIDGQIAGEYGVVDEKKYLMFLMKFGS
jgi:hypothetical protein